MIPHFDHPWLLLLAPVLPLLMFLLLRASYLRRLERIARLGERTVVERILPQGSVEKPAGRMLLLGVAGFLSGIALAGPRWGTEISSVQGSGVDMVVALDASLSMLATDETPNRLERMKQEVRRLRASSQGDRIGVIAFAGRSYILTPLTTDQGALDLFLDNVDPSIVGQAGSAVSRAIVQGTELLLASESSSDRALVIMSDFESHEPDTEIAEAAQKARDAGITVITVGFGSESGTRIPMEIRGRPGFKLDEEGRVVITRYNPAIMRAIAQISGGDFVASGENDKAGRVRRALSTLRAEQRSLNLGANLVPRFQIFLFPALILFLLDTFRSELRGLVSKVRHQRDRARHLRRAAASSGLAALLVIPMRLAPSVQVETPQQSVAADAQDRAEAARRRVALDSVAFYRKLVEGGEATERALYNLGTALLRADSVQSAIPILERVAKSENEELRFRAQFNLGLGQIRAAGEMSGAQKEVALDAAIENYRNALLMRPADADAKWNYELALRAKEEAAAGGAGGQDQQQQQQEQEPQPQQLQDPRDQQSGLDRNQAEQILDNAAREERDVQSRSQDRNRPGRPPGGKDW